MDAQILLLFYNYKALAYIGLVPCLLPFEIWMGRAREPLCLLGRMVSHPMLHNVFFSKRDVPYPSQLNFLFRPPHSITFPFDFLHSRGLGSAAAKINQSREFDFHSRDVTSNLGLASKLISPSRASLAQ